MLCGQMDIWLLSIMVMEMIDTEPPFFSEAPLMAMKKIRDLEPPTLKNPDKVCTLWEKQIVENNTPWKYFFN